MKHFLLSLVLSGIFSASLLGGEKNDISRFDSLAREIETSAFSQATRSKKLVEELQTIAKNHLDNMNLAIRSLYWEAKINCLHDISTPALTVKVLKAMEEWKLEKHPFERTLLNHTLALCYLADGNYAKAFATALEVLEHYQHLKNTDAYRVKTLILLGNMCLKTQNVTMAIDYYKQALSQVTPELEEYYSILIVLYTHLGNMNLQNSYTDSLTSLVPILEQKRDTALLITTYFNLGTLFINKGEMDKGYGCY